METQTANTKKGAQEDVNAILTQEVIEKLHKGIVPWHVSWTKAGLPENVVSGNGYRGVNRILLASLGYERNLFLTSKQVKDVGGSILPDEKPHLVTYFSDSGARSETESTGVETREGKKRMELKPYTVFNVAQCSWPSDKTFPEVKPEIEEIQKSVEFKTKDQKRPYYDALFDFINMPGEKQFESKEDRCRAVFHQLIHSTGHHSRLNRKDLVQMSEFGYDAFSHEELVAEIGASYLASHHGISAEFVPTNEYLAGWIRRFERDKYLIFSAAQQAEKAVSFLFLGATDQG